MSDYSKHQPKFQTSTKGSSVLTDPRPSESAFSRFDLGATVAVVGLLSFLVISSHTDAQVTDHTVACMNNLKQVYLAFKTFSIDYEQRFPMAVSAKDGGSREFVAGGNAFRHFQVLSNELSNPNVLLCPADNRKPAFNFAKLADTNVSYFVGVDANPKRPSMLMAGDRNLTLNGAIINSGLVSIKSTDAAGWGENLHRVQGNMLTTQPALLPSVSEQRLRLLLRSTGTNINRLAIP